MLPVFCLIFKNFEISLNPFLVATSNQNEKKIAPPDLVCHGLPKNAFLVNQLYNVTWSSTYYIGSTYLCLFQKSNSIVTIVSEY